MHIMGEIGFRVVGGYGICRGGYGIRKGGYGIRPYGMGYNFNDGMEMFGHDYIFV